MIRFLESRPLRRRYSVAPKIIVSAIVLAAHSGARCVAPRASRTQLYRLGVSGKTQAAP